MIRYSPIPPNEDAHEQFGMHLTVDGYDADAARLRDRDLLEWLPDSLPAISLYLTV